MEKVNDKPEHRTGIEDYYIIKNNKKMRFGYTTGTCAAAAAKAATAMLLDREETPYVRLTTPKGIELDLTVLDIDRGSDYVTCAIRKDAGDDPDVTDGILVKAGVRKVTLDTDDMDSEQVMILGGEGVGVVTKKGLEQPVGAPAINKVPRQMIKDGIQEICEKAGYTGAIEVTISVPEGEAVSKGTFNPRLGIMGGISILGTSGIVEPMSETALLKSLEVEMRQQIENGRKHLIVTLGNYGRAYLNDLSRLPLKDSIKCSNYVGEVIDMAVDMEAESLLFIAHLGKFVKVAGGIMNTHSRDADCRAEIMCTAAMRAGISREGAMRILDTVTTDEALAIIREENLQKETIKQLTDKIGYYLNHRAYGRINTEALIFSNEYGYLGETAGCSTLMEKIIEEGMGAI